MAVTAVQFLGAALAALPVAVVHRGRAARPPRRGRRRAGGLAVVGLTVVGTLAPFTLFAYGQHKVSTEVAGAFLNLEPLVGAMVGVVAFGDPAGPRLFVGGVAILGGIFMSSLPALRATAAGARASPRRGSSRPARLEGRPPGVSTCLVHVSVSSLGVVPGVLRAPRVAASDSPCAVAGVAGCGAGQCRPGAPGVPAVMGAGGGGHVVPGGHRGGAVRRGGA